MTTVAASNTGITRSLTATAFARILTLALGFGSNLLVARLILAHLGVPLFASIALISTVADLIPFADLGVGSALVNHASDLKRTNSRSTLIGPVVAALYVCIAAALAISLLGGVLHYLNAWSGILGAGVRPLEGFSLAATSTLLVFAATVPFGLGQRILQGLGLNHWPTAIQALAPFLRVAGAWLIIFMGLPVQFLATIPALASFTCAVAIFAFALRKADIGIANLRGVRPSGRMVRSILGFGLSAVVVSTSYALTFQAQRIMLSHASSAEELALYSLAAPVFAAVMSVLALSAQGLWPHYRQEMAAGRLTRNTMIRHVRYSAAIGLTAGACAAVGVWLYIQASAGARLQPSWALCASVGTLVLGITLILPAEMFLTAPDLMRFQARLGFSSALISLPVSLFMVLLQGAGGAFLGAALSVMLFRFPLGLRKALQFLPRSADHRENPHDLSRQSKSTHPPSLRQYPKACSRWRG
jgi:O-antigen/teichoic acid export membrane protein